jgi:hypothetical protein
MVYFLKGTKIMGKGITRDGLLEVKMCNGG